MHFPILIMLLALGAAGCANPGPIYHRLADRAETDGAPQSAAEAAKLGEPRCIPPTDGRWRLEFKDKDPIVKQADDPAVFTTYRVLCAEIVVGRPLVIEANGSYVDGRYGEAFFFLPKVTVLDESFTELTGEPTEVRFEQGKSVSDSEFYTRWDAKQSRSHRILIVVTAENRPQKAGRWTARSVVDSARGPLFEWVKVRTFPIGRVYVKVRQPERIEAIKPKMDLLKSATPPE